MAAAAADLSGVTVTAPANPDYNLVSRNVLPDGSIGECRRVMDDRPGWLTVECSAGPFVGGSVYRPLSAPSAVAGASPAQTASSENRSAMVMEAARTASGG